MAQSIAGHMVDCVSWVQAGSKERACPRHGSIRTSARDGR